MPHPSPREVLFLLLLFLLPTGGRGQEYIVQHRVFSIEDGLFSRFVRKVIQDQRGFIWIATSEGLDRYDGEQVLHYTKEQHGLPANDINLLFEGPDGRLWVGNWEIKDHNGVMGGNLKVSFFDPITETASTFREYFGDKAPFEEDELFGLQVDDSRRAWLGTYSGKAYRYDGGHFELLVDNKGASPISYALPALENTFWLLGPHALLRVDSAGREVERDAFTGRFLPHKIIFLQNGGLLAEDWYTMRIKYPGQGLARQYRLTGGGAVDISPYLKIQEGQGGRLWGFKKHRLEVFDAAGQMIAGFPKDPPADAPYSFQLPFSSLFTDRDRLAWVIPQENLLLLDIRENGFQPYLQGQGYSLRAMIALGQEEILVNTYKGIHQLNLSSGEAKLLFENPDLQALGAIRAPSGEVWAALHGSKAARINLEDNSMELFSIKNQKGISFDPYCPFIARNGKLWMGTEGGIAAFDTTSRQFVFDLYLNHYLGGKAINWFCEDEEGIWIGSSEGLFLLSDNGTRIQKAEELPPFHIYHIYPESPSRFWLSTRGGGLIRWDRAEGGFQQFTVKDGLSSNIIYAAYPDDNGFLWLPSQNGLMRFSPSNNIARIFKEIQGLPSNEFNNYAHLRLDDGRLLFGTIDGLAVFSPKDIPGGQSENTQLSILEAEQFNSSSGRMERITRQVIRQGRVELTSSRRLAVLQFFLSDYLNPEKNRYFYKIEGLDPTWQIMAENQVSVGQLPWGRYTLRVRAMGQDGYWAGNELAIPVYSIRPVYLRWWFILLAASAATGLVALLFRWRLWQLKRSKLLLEAEVARRTQQVEQKRQTIAEQKARLEEMNAAKDKLFSIVGHELRGPLMYFGNIANRISYALQKKEYEHLEGLGEKVKTIASSTNNMLNNLLNWSLLESGRLSFGKGPADVQAVLMQVMETYQEVAGLKRLELSLDATPGLWVQAGADGLAILLQNLVSNAIKFTPEGGAVSIRASQKEGRVAIAVKDDGIGMAKEKTAQLFSAPFQLASLGTAGERGAGLGLQIVQEILRRNGGMLEVESRKGGGSTFTLLLPGESIV